MLNKTLPIAAACALLMLPSTYAADQPAGAPIEYELVNDFAARMQTHLQQTAKILEQLRQTTEPAERKKLMDAYLAAVNTTAHITHTMQQMLDGGEGMGMGKKKTGGMMKGGKCGMMAGPKGGKDKAAAAEDEEPGEDDKADAGAGGQKEDEHAGHH
jgi:uncharacterized protein (DUF305 family)